MTHNQLPLLVASTITVMAVGTIQAPSAQAGLLTQDFTISDPIPSLPGAPFSGSFTYNDMGLTGVGDEMAALNSFNVNLLGQTFNDASDGQAIFFDGDFLGIAIGDDGPQISFEFLPGFFDISEASFAFEFNNQPGFADVSYGDPKPVPGPSLLPGLIGMSIAAFRRKRQNNDEARATLQDL